MKSPIECFGIIFIIRRTFSKMAEPFGATRKPMFWSGNMGIRHPLAWVDFNPTAGFNSCKTTKNLGTVLLTWSQNDQRLLNGCVKCGLIYNDGSVCCSWSDQGAFTGDMTAITLKFLERGKRWFDGTNINANYDKSVYTLLTAYTRIYFLGEIFSHFKLYRYWNFFF
jgi:hypothetical protein